MNSFADLRANPDADAIRDLVLLRIEPTVAIRMPRAELTQRIDALVSAIADERRALLNWTEQRALTSEIVDDMIGLGPLEPLLRDDTVNDVLVNGPDKIYVERKG